MKTHPTAVTLLVFGIALGFLWAGGCSDDNRSVASPTPQSTSSGAVFVCYVGTPATNASVWSLNGGASGTENTSAAPIPRAGTLKNLFVAPTVAFGSGSVTVVVRKNGVDTSLLVVYGTADGTTVKSNTTDTVTVAAGDLVSIEFRETAGGTPGGILKAGLSFD